MKLCDSSYLIAFLHPNPNPPMDRQGKPVTLFRERISALIEELSATNDVIGIPAPALAETLVRSGPNRAQYMKVLNDSWKFQMIPFDSRAAIETADLIASVKAGKEQWGTWAKVKFDIQIVAIAKAEGVSVIYSDDYDIENYAKRLNIHVVRICDLPTPIPVKTTAIAPAPSGPQMNLPLMTQPIIGAEQTATSTSKEPVSEETASDASDDVAIVERSYEFEATPLKPAAVQGIEGAETLSEAATVVEQPIAQVDNISEKAKAPIEGGLTDSSS